MVLFQLYFSCIWDLATPEIYRRRWYVIVLSKGYVGVGDFFIYLVGSCQLNWMCNCIWKFSDLFDCWDLEKNCKPVTHLHKIFLLLRHLSGTAMQLCKWTLRNLSYKPAIQQFSLDAPVGVLCRSPVTIEWANVIPNTFGSFLQKSFEWMFHFSVSVMRQISWARHEHRTACSQLCAGW